MKRLWIKLRIALRRYSRQRRAKKRVVTVAYQPARVLARKFMAEAAENKRHRKEQRQYLERIDVVCAENSRLIAERDYWQKQANHYKHKLHMLPRRQHKPNRCVVGNHGK